MLNVSLPVFIEMLDQVASPEGFRGVEFGPIKQQLRELENSLLVFNGLLDEMSRDGIDRRGACGVLVADSVNRLEGIASALGFTVNEDGEWDDGSE